MMTSRRVVAQLFLLFLIFPLHSASAATVEITSNTSTISQVIKYTDALGGGLEDALVVVISDPSDSSQCDGGWIKATDKQYATVSEMVLAAKITLAPIRLAGDPAVLFSGSSDQYCYLHFVALP